MTERDNTRNVMINDITMWLGFEKRELREMQLIDPMSDVYKAKWTAAGSFHSMAHAIYIVGLKAGLLTISDFTDEFLGSAA